uniref:Uncharacterized protein n=1 Tax=Rhizophora mucronata TaxID=61149 RepID=A0A2P2KKE4_RHIMU
MSKVWVNPRATNLALYLFMVPFGLYFIVNIHLHPTTFFSLGNLTISLVLFSVNVFISSNTAVFQLGSFEALRILLEISILSIFVVNVLY